MSRQITVTVSDLVYSRLARRARDIGRGTKPEDIAEDWIEQQARESADLDQRFVEAGRKVTQLLGVRR